ncbi:MAG: HlyD family type I secretion periplasmic adaptor subunit [Desulfobulbaceae bacterium]|nr:HlyD family type I secretion periplasmic adaptor subunit [Desulfobulbaceae bacterium]MDY0352172.1 HlyD family type I secretion periplasmic adaptor subunit [Desulfobulbaceae bacterium]
MAKKKKGPGIFRRLPLPDVDLTTDIRNSILDQSPPGGRNILWLILVLSVVAVIWAYRSEVEEVTRGQGRVIPSRQIQVVQNLEGGILSEILVNVGEIVNKDQLLLKIDDTRFSAPFRESRNRFLMLKAKVARLEAETEGEDFEVPPDVAEENPEAAKREENLFLSRKEAYQNQIAILEEQVTQRAQELGELQAREKQLQRSLSFLQRELEMTRPLVQQGAVSEVEMLRLEREANKLNGDLESTRYQIPQVRSRLQEAKRSIEDRRLNYQNQAKEELNDILSELEGLSVSSVALEDRLKRTLVRSPVRGTINQILVNTVGGVIQPGMDLMEIVPLEDTLLVETKIKPSDIAFLHPGQKALVKFSAYDFTMYGGLEGDVEHISADSITDEKGENFYLVRVRTTRNFLGAEENPMPIIPGMVGEVDILTGKKTILSYLLKPALRAQKMALRER